MYIRPYVTPTMRRPAVNKLACLKAMSKIIFHSQFIRFIFKYLPQQAESKVEN